MSKYKWIIFSVVFVVFVLFESCEKDDTTTNNTTTVVTEDNIDEADDNNETDFEESGDYTWDISTEVTITLNGSSITIDGEGATASGSVLTISSVGNYNISGTLDDGQIIVNTEEEGMVRLILNSATITCSNSAPVYIKKADKTVLILTAGTANYLTDGSNYVFESSDDDEPNATLFSKDNLSIYGEGSLTIDANYNDAITSKDGLIINSGTITINSVDDGIRGKDFLIVKSGTINISSAGDGLKSDNEDDAACGYISIESGDITIISATDGMQAETDILVTSGNISITSGGGSSKTVSSSVSAKGIKSGVQFIIEGGTLNISSADDALHTNGNLTINSGTLTLSSGDDGMHAESTIDINGADITISKSVEGVEAAIINVNDGTISVVSSDDGFNATNSTITGGTESDDGSELNIYGGYILVSASADGLDSNGSFEMTGGTVVVYGSSSQMENGIDVNGAIQVNGGELIVAEPSSSTSTETPSTGSSQYSVMVYFSSTQSASSLFHIQDASGEEVVTFKLSKSYYSILYSSAVFTSGSTYYIYTGGEYTNGDEVNGFYSGGTYSGGTQYSSFTISAKVTKVGSSQGGNTNPGSRN